MVLEYEPDAGGIDLGLDLATFGEGGSLLISAHVRDADDLGAELDFDVHRSIRSHTAYTGLLHRLGHDPMSNLDRIARRMAKARGVPPEVRHRNLLGGLSP